jgi:hypothetical protein
LFCQKKFTVLGTCLWFNKLPAAHQMTASLALPAGSNSREKSLVLRSALRPESSPPVHH